MKPALGTSGWTGIGRRFSVAMERKHSYIHMSRRCGEKDDASSNSQISIIRSALAGGELVAARKREWRHTVGIKKSSICDPEGMSEMRSRVCDDTLG